MKSVFDAPRQMSGLGSPAFRIMLGYVIFHIHRQALALSAPFRAVMSPAIEIYAIFVVSPAIQESARTELETKEIPVLVSIPSSSGNVRALHAQINKPVY